MTQAPYVAEPLDLTAKFTVVVHLCTGRTYPVYPDSKEKAIDIYLRKVTTGIEQQPASPFSADVHVRFVSLFKRGADQEIEYMIDSGELECSCA